MEEGSNRKISAKWALGLVILSIGMGTAVYHWVAQSLVDFRAGDVGLGIATTTYESSWADTLALTHTQGNYSQILPTWQYYAQEGHPIALWFGNSQLHAVNYFEKGQETAVWHATQWAVNAQTPERYLQLSSPNVNPHEILVYYLALKHQGYIPDWVLVGLPLRSFHLVDIRNRFVNHLRALPLDSLGLSAQVAEIYRGYGAEAETKATLQQPERTQTPQDITEQYLVEKMEMAWPAYSYRGNVRSKLSILPGQLYQQYTAKEYSLTGSDFSVSQNLLLIKELVRQCEADGVKVLIYEPPHPTEPGKPFQYDRKQYQGTFDALAALAEAKDGVYFADFSEAVPLNLWGLNNRGWLDIFHFKEEGHQILGERMAETLTSLTRKEGRP